MDLAVEVFDDLGRHCEEPAGDTDSFSGPLVDDCLAVLDLIEQLLDECLFEGLYARLNVEMMYWLMRVPEGNLLPTSFDDG